MVIFPETMHFGSGPTLGGHQSAQVNDRKRENAPFLFCREITIRQRLEEKGEETTVWVAERAKTNRCGVVLLAADSYICRLKQQLSFISTMILVNGHGVTTYCDPPQKNKNLISLKWKQLFWKHLNQAVHTTINSVPVWHWHCFIVERWMKGIYLLSSMRCLEVKGLIGTAVLTVVFHLSNTIICLILINLSVKIEIFQCSWQIGEGEAHISPC